MNEQAQQQRPGWTSYLPIRKSGDLPLSWRGFVNRLLERIGYRLTNLHGTQHDMFSDREFAQIHELCRRFTMTTPQAMYSAVEAVRYLHDNQIAGDFVECGVWKGGSSMAMAKTLGMLEDTSRRLFLYDMFGGESIDGDEYWAGVDLETVEKNVLATKFPAARLVFVPGDIRNAVDDVVPDEVALLRLDMDVYAPTKAALRALYPKVARGGVVMIDDYGSHPEGAQKATDEFLKEQGLRVLLHRVDHGLRYWVKP